MARRNNATFTLDQTYGFGYGDRSLIQAFYRALNDLCPGDMPIPIPPESQVHPQHDAETQAFIFADYAVRGIAQIALHALRVAGVERYVATLEQLDPITDKVSAKAAADAARVASYRLIDAAAELNPGADPGAYRAAKAANANAANAALLAAEAADAPDALKTRKTRFGASFAAHAAVEAAELNPDATWAAVNAMLQAL